MPWQASGQGAAVTALALPDLAGVGGAQVSVRARRWHLTLRTRLMLGMGAICALLLLLTVGVLWHFQKTEHQMRRIVEVHNLRSQQARELNAAQLEWVLQLRTLLVATDPDDQAMLSESLGSAIKRYRDTEQGLRQVLGEAGGQTDSLSGTLDGIVQIRESIEPAYGAAVKAILGGTGADAALVLLMPAESAEMRWREQILQLVQAAERSNQDELERALVRQNAATVGVSALAGISMVLAILLATSLVRSISNGVSMAVALAQRIAEGNLRASIPAREQRRQDELGHLVDAMAQMQARLRVTVETLQQSSASVRLASGECGEGSQRLSRRTEASAQQIERVAAVVGQLGGALTQSRQLADDASGLASGARRDAQEGNTAVVHLDEQMQRIAAVSRRITDIVGAIDSIAFQTSILALNASVEAARAGPQGRGFAVVAAEVRELAQRAARSAGEIRALSAETEHTIRTGQNSVAAVGATVGQLGDTVARVAQVVDTISAGSERQVGALQDVTTTVAALDALTQENAALAEQLAAVAQGLQQGADELAGQLTQFDLGEPAPTPETRPDRTRTLQMELT